MLIPNGEIMKGYGKYNIGKAGYNMYKKIFVDQCGYQPQMKKYVTFQAQKPVEFSVLRSDGECVMKGNTDKRFENASAKEVDYIGDFSKLTTPGRYYIVAKGLGESDTFEIREDIYADTFQKTMYFFYLQRCGCPFLSEI